MLKAKAEAEARFEQERRRIFGSESQMQKYSFKPAF
jgi:hypothetical protein